MATMAPERWTARTQGRILAQCQVRADLIVVRCISRKNLSQMRRTKDQHPVQALAAHGANQTLHIQARSVGLGCPWPSPGDRSTWCCAKHQSAGQHVLSPSSAM